MLTRSSVNMMLAACGVDSEREVKVIESSWPKKTSMSPRKFQKSKTFKAEGFAEGCPEDVGKPCFPKDTHTHPLI